jgi:hypothetical protein
MEFFLLPFFFKIGEIIFGLVLDDCSGRRPGHVGNIGHAGSTNHSSDDDGSHILLTGKDSDPLPSAE